jgi:hypothetical protein
MARRGRKQRKDGPRGESGRLLERGEVIPPYALIRRAEMLGMTVEKRGRGRPSTPSLEKVDGSSALGVLLARGVLAQYQYDAGLRLAETHRRLARAIAAKPLHPKVMGINGPHDGPSPRDHAEGEWTEAAEKMDKARSAVSRELGWHHANKVAVLDEIPPQVLSAGAMGDVHRAELRKAMDQLAKHYRIEIPKKEGGNKAA